MRKKWRFTPEQIEGARLVALERGKKDDEDYRMRLIQKFGEVPEWAPKRIQR